MNNFCFVIQPINADKFTKRYDDTFKPAIEESGLNAYRVDLDSSVKVPIENIEEKIKLSQLCFADISVDNPNVWYELGYAFASGKDVVMVCDESRIDFPFDIQHKHIIKYKTESKSDFDELRKKITEKIVAYLENQKTTQKILDIPIKENSELRAHELVILAALLSEQIADEDSVSTWTLKDRMEKAGYNEMALSIGLRQLKKKEFIITGRDTDYNGNEYTICKIAQKGIDYILANTEMFDLKQKHKNISMYIIDEDDTLPF